MTKEEAFEAIAKVSDYEGWTEYRDKIMTILDGLDSAPTEFTVKELFELMQQDPHLEYVRLYPDSCAFIRREVGHRDFTRLGIEAIRDKLLELAKPPEPQTAPCDVPIKWLQLWAKTDVMTPESQIAKANAKVALERAGLSVEK